MAFGALLGTATGSSSSPGTSLATSSGITVAKGDLVVVSLHVRDSLANLGTVSINDTLTNSWTQLSSNDPIVPNRYLTKFYTIVTNAGTMTPTVSWTGSTSGDAVVLMARFEGPFAVSPVDANPNNATDSTSPYDCPSTGTLSQPDELVLGFASNGNGLSYTATAPNAIAVQLNTGTGSNTHGGAIGYQVVAATSAVAPQFTASSTTGSVGTASFKKDIVTPTHPVYRQNINMPKLRTSVVGY